MAPLNLTIVTQKYRVFKATCNHLTLWSDHYYYVITLQICVCTAYYKEGHSPLLIYYELLIVPNACKAGFQEKCFQGGCIPMRFLQKPYETKSIPTIKYYHTL